MVADGIMENGNLHLAGKRLCHGIHKGSNQGINLAAMVRTAA
jgi:hypothetical protein